MHDQVSQESVMGGVKKTLDAVLSGHLKHVREAGDIIKQCRGLVASTTVKVLRNKEVATLVRPDESFCKDPVRYCQDVLSFLKEYHDDGLWPGHIKFIKQVNEVLKGLDTSSHGAFKSSLLSVAKQLPQSPIDKLSHKARTMEGPGIYRRVFQEADHVYEQMTPFQECNRFWKPTQLIFATYLDNKRKPYAGNGELPLLSPEQIAKVLDVYVQAEKYFAIARKLESRPWPGFVGKGQQIFKMYGVDNDYRLWSKYVDNKDVLTTYASYSLMVNWMRGMGSMTGSAYYSTSHFRYFLEALFKWAKRSFEIHAGTVSTESIPTAFKW